MFVCRRSEGRRSATRDRTHRGNVVDRTGAPARRAALVLRSDRSVHAAPPGEVVLTGNVVDVSGLTVAPGVIDMHAHSDLAAPADPAYEARVMEGVALEFVGQDELGHAPVTDVTADELHARLTGWSAPPAPTWSSSAPTRWTHRPPTTTPAALPPVSNTFSSVGSSRSGRVGAPTVFPAGPSGGTR